MDLNQLDSQLVKGLVAGATVNPKRFVKRGSTDDTIIQATDGTAPFLGVTRGDAGFPFSQGAIVDTVILNGIEEIDFGDTITQGQPLKADSNGKAVPATAGDFYGGYAAKSGQSGDLGAVIVCPGQLALTPENPLPINKGGTNSSTAANARTALGLGAAAVLGSPIPVANGGTNATTAADARTSLGLGAAAVASKATNQPASEATDAAGVVADFNTLLTKLKTAGLMVADS